MAELTYHSYQQILDLQDDGQKLRQRPARRKFKKSLNGCLVCKQKRKKCDESKPACSGCVRRGCDCVWPEHVLKRGFEQHEKGTIPEPQHLNLNEDVTITNINNNINSINDFFNNDPLLYEFLRIQDNIEQDEFMPAPRSRRSSSTVTSFAFEEFENSIPGVEFTREEARCYDAFVKTFLTSITPAHCDPLLSPMTLLLPYAVESETVREIFLACGATQLAYADDEFVAKSHQRYVKSVGLLVSEIQRSTDGCEDQLFIAVQLLQTLCLRDKSLGLNATKSAGHLAASYEILKKRFLKCAIRGSFGLHLSPLDRILTEHFIFNFPITVILCRHDKLAKLPSPFQFFEQFGGMLTRPFSDPNLPQDEWTSHPILGVSLKSHEICTKTTWLMRTKTLPLDPEDALRALELREQMSSELVRLYSLLSDDLTSAQRQSIAFARAKLYASSVLLRRLCNPQVGIHDAELQYDVQCIVDEMKSSMRLDTTHLLSLWAMFVGGSAAIKEEHRRFFEQGFISVSGLIRSSLAQKVLRYLNIVWDEHDNVGLEFMFDTTVLDIVCT